MAEGDCEKCGGWGACMQCKKTGGDGVLLDGSDCECAYGQTQTIGVCVGCAGSGDSKNAVPEALLEFERTKQQLTNPKDPLPSDKEVDWDALFGGGD